MNVKPLALAINNFSGLEDWFPVFRTGEHTDSQGRTRTFTEADLDSMVANHNNDEPAPFVFGHPKENDPAYGWVAGLKRDGEVLLAKGKDIITEFGEAVRKKMFPNRSISIEPEGDGWRVRHIGFLGARRPAVSGLGNIAFSENDQALEFSLSTEEGHNISYGFRTVARMLRGFRDWIIQERDVETADQILPDWEIDAVAQTGNDLRPQQPSYSKQQEVNMDKQFTQADVDAAVRKARDEEQSKNKSELSKLQYAAAVEKHQRTVDALVEEGRLLPAQTKGLAEFMAGLSAEDASAFEFSTGEEGKNEKLTPSKFMANFVAALGKQIDMGRDTSEPPEQDDQNYSYPNAAVSPERAELDKAAREYARKHNVDYITAVFAVEKGGK